MLYPKNIEQKLGFDKIRDLIREACVSTLGQQFVDKMRFADHYDTVDRLIRQTAEFKNIVQYEPDFPSSNYLDATPALTKANVEGTFLTEEEAFELSLSLRTVAACVQFFAQREPTTYPTLRELTQAVAIDRSLLAALDAVIDDRGHVRDTASPELQALRRQIISEQSNLRKRLDAVLRQAKSQGWMPDEASLTVRGGRMVIPVMAEHKRKIKGFVHDESATGQTVYLEPAEIFDANNEIRDLEYRERREVVRVLTELTSRIRPHVPALRRAYTFLGLMDFIRAKARLAVRTQATNPLFVNAPVIAWTDATHPLLYLSHQKQGKGVVPLTIRLTAEHRILLISGPNAGGKSILLKTVGLVQYMFQCGLLVPMNDQSQVGFFRSVFIDIGDEQSLENDLSTYSSHLTNMKHFLHHADPRTLFLIDEFGTGTEPGVGGAIAESILEQLNGRGAYGVINTHYTNLKVYADRHAGLVNGAMRFDGERLEPMYQLEIGQPGSSFAFEIAHKIGLPTTIIDRAKERVGGQQVSFEKLLKELEIERKVFAERNVDNATKERKLAQTLREYTELKDYLDNERKKMLNEAKVQAKQLVKDANQKIEQTIREIRERRADKEETRAVRRDLETFENTLRPEPVTVEPAPLTAEAAIELEAGAIEVGGLVRLRDQGTVGEVLALRGNNAEVAFGELKTTVKLTRLERISRKAYKAATKPDAPRTVGLDLNERLMNFSFNLDLRGRRGDEALAALDPFMDNALILGQSELRIVHGKGDGILRTLVRNHLRQHYPQVSSLADEHPDRGGPGVTLVRMK